MNPVEALGPGEIYRGPMVTFRANVTHFERVASGARASWCFSNHSTVAEGTVVRFVEFDPEKVKSTGRQFWAVAGPSVEDSPKRWRLELVEVTPIDDSRDYMTKGPSFAGLKHDADVRRFGRACDASAEADV